MGGEGGGVEDDGQREMTGRTEVLIKFSSKEANEV